MKKLGFTLAEVLICIGILGVVAMLTLPALMSDVKKHQVGPALAKAINTLRTTNDFAIQQYNARDLIEILETDGIDDSGYFEGVLTKFMQFDKITNPKNYKKFDKASAYAVINDRKEGYQTKDGLSFYRPVDSNPKSLSSTAHLGKGYSGKYYVVYVDINGPHKKPNNLGRDVFQLWVDTKGVVIPYGGAAHKAYTNSSKILWHTACMREVSDAEACAGSVVDNAYKVVYKY